jgi:hypothetical protein
VFTLPPQDQAKYTIDELFDKYEDKVVKITSDDSRTITGTLFTYELAIDGEYEYDTVILLHDGLPYGDCIAVNKIKNIELVDKR